jgi:hypothetical protein
MEQLPEDRDKYAKNTHRRVYDTIEKEFHEISADTCSQVKNAIDLAIHAAMEKGNAQMADNSAILRATVGGLEAERICRATILDRKTLAQKTRDSLLSDWCEKDGYRIPPVLSRFMTRPITLDSDPDDAQANDASDDDAAQADNRLETGDGDTQASHHMVCFPVLLCL